MRFLTVRDGEKCGAVWTRLVRTGKGCNFARENERPPWWMGLECARRARWKIAPAERLQQRLLYFDTADEGLVGDRGEDDHVLAARVGVGRERLDERAVLPTRRLQDVEVGEYLRSVDAHVKHALTGRSPERFAEGQPHGVARSPPQAGNPGGEPRAPAARRRRARRLRPSPPPPVAAAPPRASVRRTCH